MFIARCTLLPNLSHFSHRITRLCVDHIHTSLHTHRWYKHYFQIKRVLDPPKRPISFEWDCEHQTYPVVDPKATTYSAQSLLENVDKLSDQDKRLFTYEFMRKTDELNERTIRTLAELGFHPTDKSTAAEVVRLTMEIRSRKKLCMEHIRNKPLLISTRCCIRKRLRLLRLLRLTNKPEFDRLVTALSITNYQHLDPFDQPNTDPNADRKKAVREECYKSRLAKLSRLKASFALDEANFYKRKEETLRDILKDLTTLTDKTDVENRHYADLMLLRTLFNEVLDARQNEVLKAPLEDQLKWYTNEAVERERYAAEQAEKTERQLRRKRK